MAKQIVNNLVNKGLIEPAVSVEQLMEETGNLLLDELMAEDRLNDEVRQLLKKYESEIAKGRLDFRKLFDMTKQKLVRERNIIL
ncbi:MAG: DUF507 family protein [Nitrospirae bacterium]|nr:DUF507 family protein [Nitrospirota bacterium]